MGKRILVTRPEQQGRSLSERLRAGGHDVRHIPVMATEALKDEKSLSGIARCFAHLGEFDACVVVSLNAAEQALPWWQQYPLSRQDVFAVGKSTADFLQASALWAGRHPVIYPHPQMNSEALLALPALTAAQVSGKRFLILRGVGGRELIAETLLARGAQVESCELYRRTLPTAAAEPLQSTLPETDVLILNSVESLQNFLILAGNFRAFDKVLLVPGQRVGDAARAAGFRHIIVAANATDTAVLEALQGL